MKTELFNKKQNLSSDFWTFVAKTYFENDKKQAKRSLRNCEFSALEKSDIEKLQKAGLSKDIAILKSRYSVTV